MSPQKSIRGMEWERVECEGRVVYWDPEFPSLPGALAPISCSSVALCFVCGFLPEAGLDTGRSCFQLPICIVASRGRDKTPFPRSLPEDQERAFPETSSFESP